MSKRVCCLYRVSTKKQLEKTNVEKNETIPMQEQSCREFAEQQGWTITMELYEKGVSGFKISAKDRDAIQEARQAAIEGKFDIILVYMFDRLGRRDDETPFVVEWFVQNGIEVWSVVEGQQRFESHVDKLMNYIRYWQASGESIKTSIRTKTRLGQIIQEGRFRGGTAPYGYRLEKHGRLNRRGYEVNEIVVDESEALVIGRIFEIALQRGCGGRKIATMLVEEGIRNRSGAKFHYSTIQNILKNITYTGVLRSGESRSEAFAHLQIIPFAIFERVQELLKSRRTNYEKSRLTPLRQEGENLLSGNIFCGCCGGRIFGSTTRKTHHPSANAYKIRVPVYKCYNRSQHRGLCSGQSVYQAKDIDRSVEEAIKDVLHKVKLVNASVYMKERRTKELATIKSQLHRLETEYGSHIEEQQKLSGYIVASLEGKSPFAPEDLKIRMDFLKERCKQISIQIEEQKDILKQAEQKNEFIGTQLDKLRGYTEVFENSTSAERRMIASALIERVTVHPGYELEIQFRVGVDSLTEFPSKI